MPSVADSVAVVLAAGGGSRFDGAAPKLRAKLAGRPVLAWSLAAMQAAGFARVLVVAGPVEFDDLVPELATVVPNERWSDGVATSVQAAVAHVRAWPDPPERLVIGLGDQIGVGPEAWRAVAGAGGPVAVATYGGQRGHPVALDRSVWDLLPATGDEGTRALLEAHPDLVHEVPCAGDPTDIDTVDDLDRAMPAPFEWSTLRSRRQPFRSTPEQRAAEPRPGASEPA